VFKNKPGIEVIYERERGGWKDECLDIVASSWYFTKVKNGTV
jgi:hypothetical protein